MTGGAANANNMETKPSVPYNFLRLYTMSIGWAINSRSFLVAYSSVWYYPTTQRHVCYILMFYFCSFGNRYNRNLQSNSNMQTWEGKLFTTVNVTRAPCSTRPLLNNVPAMSYSEKSVNHIPFN